MDGEAGYEQETAKRNGVLPVGTSDGLEALWQTQIPTEPGWYWYENEYYGPAPVKVEWTGFVNHPDARQLEITIACGEDSDQPLGEIKSLPMDGRWQAFNFVPEGC